MDTITPGTWARVRLHPGCPGDGRRPHHLAEDGCRVKVTTIRNDGDHPTFASYKGGNGSYVGPRPDGGLGIGRYFRPDELDPIPGPAWPARDVRGTLTAPSLPSMDDRTLLMDGARYRFRRWPDDGETFEFRAVGPGGAGVLVNLTNPGSTNDFWVRADGEVWTTDGHRVFDVTELAPGPGDSLTGNFRRV